MGIEDRCWFHEVVPVLDERTGVTIRVNNCIQAGQLLMEKWPVKPGPSHRAARQALVKDLSDWSDRRATQRARDAFEKAARDAKILAER